MLEILRRSAKVAFREGAVRIFSRNTELLTAPALRVLPSRGMCAKYYEGQQKWAQARTQLLRRYRQKQGSQRGLYLNEDKFEHLRLLKAASFAFQTPRRACARVTCAFHISLLRTLSLSFLKLNILERT